MPPKHKLSRLNIEDKVSVDKIVADNTLTIKEKHKKVQDAGIEVSESAFYRYQKNLLQMGEDMNAFNDTARTVAEMNKAGGEVLMAKTLITYIQTAIFKRIMGIEHIEEAPLEDFQKYTAMVTKMANALVDLNKLPQFSIDDADIEHKVNKMVEEYLKVISTQPKETKKAKKEK